MRAAWEDLVRHTDILRTSFRYLDEDNTWRVIVRSQPDIVWTEHDSSIDVKQVLSLLKKTFVFRTEGDFARPLAVDVIRDICVISLHHSLYDGESIELTLQDLTSFHEGLTTPARPPFSQAALTIPYSQSDAESYWVQSLVGFQGVTYISHPGIKGEAQARLSMNYDTVHQGCKTLGVTLQSVAMLAYAKTLAWSTGQHDVVFGRIVRGRTLSSMNADEITGPLFNTVPIRVDLTRTNDTNQESSRTIQCETGESQVYQHVSLSKVQQTWRKGIGASGAELFDAVFVFQSRNESSTNKLWISINVKDDSAPTEHRINFAFHQGQIRIQSFLIRCKTGLDTLLDCFEGAFCGIIEQPGSPAKGFLEWQNKFPQR